MGEVAFEDDALAEFVDEIAIALIGGEFAGFVAVGGDVDLDAFERPAFAVGVHLGGNSGAGGERGQEQLFGGGTEADAAFFFGVVGDDGVVADVGDCQIALVEPEGSFSHEGGTPMRNSREMQTAEKGIVLRQGVGQEPRERRLRP